MKRLLQLSHRNLVIRPGVELRSKLAAGRTVVTEFARRCVGNPGKVTDISREPRRGAAPLAAYELAGSAC
jgi:hypothetical protein